MSKRSWKFRGTDADEAAKVIAAAPSLTAAARTLGVSRDTLHRWFREGLVARPPEKPARQPRHRSDTGDRSSPVSGGSRYKTFEAWARAKFNFSRGELETLKSLQLAINVRDDTAATKSERLQAAAMVCRLLRELNLPTEDEIDGDAEENPPVPFPRAVG
jgi:hypothetical protein